MAIIGDPTDPQGTKRPNEDPTLVCAHTFKPVIVADCPSKLCLPSNIPASNVYGIFSLFFTNDVLKIIVENTNRYAALHKAYNWLLILWKDTLIPKLKAYLGVLFYCSLYL